MARKRLEKAWENFLHEAYKFSFYDDNDPENYKARVEDKALIVEFPYFKMAGEPNYHIENAVSEGCTLLFVLEDDRLCGRHFFKPAIPDSNLYDNEAIAKILKRNLKLPISEHISIELKNETYEVRVVHDEDEKNLASRLQRFAEKGLNRNITITTLVAEDIVETRNRELLEVRKNKAPVVYGNDEDVDAIKRYLRVKFNDIFPQKNVEIEYRNIPGLEEKSPNIGSMFNINFRASMEEYAEITILKDRLKVVFDGYQAVIGSPDFGEMEREPFKEHKQRMAVCGRPARLIGDVKRNDPGYDFERGIGRRL